MNVFYILNILYVRLFDENILSLIHKLKTEEVFEKWIVYYFYWKYNSIGFKSFGFKYISKFR